MLFPLPLINLVQFPLVFPILSYGLLTNFFGEGVGITLLFR